MEKIDQTIKELRDIEFPPGLHGKIMRRLLFLRFRTPFLVITSLLLLNLIVSGWRLWQRLIEVEAPMFLSILVNNFEWSLDSFKEIFETAVELVPASTLTVFLINLLVLTYVFWIVAHFNTIKTKQTK